MKAIFGSAVGINWPVVFRKYSACEINPYFWEKRLTSNWYYGWDCASGCVWFAYYDEKRDEFVKIERRKKVFEDKSYV